MTVKRWLIGSLAAMSVGVGAPTLLAQDYDDYEWNPREGVHEEEWYDPGDWFDYDTGVDYDYDWWDYNYGYSPYYDDYGYNDYDYDYGYDYDDSDYGYDYGYYPGYGYYPDYDYDYDWDWGNNDSDMHTGWHVGSKAQIYGTVEDLRTVRRDRFSQPQLAATVETDNGNWRRVILGPADRFRSLELEEGDEINVIGQVRRVNGTETLVASKFSTDNIDRWINVQRQGQAQRTQGQQRPTKWYHGEILDTRTVKFKGIQNRQTVATVELNDGNIVPVNLGPAGQLPRQEIQQGDDVTLTAKVGKINGRTALIADRVKLRGQTVQIDRRADQLRFQRNQQSQDQGQASARSRR